MKVSDEASLTSFFHGKEEPARHCGGFRREKLPEPWNDVFLIIMKYLTLKGRYGVFYYYQFPLLNHFHNRDLVCLPFFLMHALEEIVMDAREKSRKGENFTILYQGLMFRLYQFHLALYLPRVLAIENLQPVAHPLHLDIGSASQALVGIVLTIE